MDSNIKSLLDELSGSFIQKTMDKYPSSLEEAASFKKYIIATCCLAEDLRKHEDIKVAVENAKRQEGYKYFLSQYCIDNYLNSILNKENYTIFDDLYVELSVEKTKDKQQAERLPLPYELDGITLQDFSTNSPKQGSELKEKEVPIITAIENNPNLVILGEQGAGKTSTLKHLCVHFAKKYIKNKAKIIPVFVALDAYGINHSKLKYVIRDSINPFIDMSLSDLLKNHKCILFLDGYNEIPEKYRNKTLEKELQCFFDDERYGCVLTSRREGYNGQINAKTMEVEPFDYKKIKKLIKKYLKHLKSGKSTDSMLNTLKSNSKLMDLAENPFCLIIMVLIYNKTGTIPTQLGLIFRHLMSVIYEGNNSWEDKKNKNKFKKIKTEILADLAYKIIEQGNVAISIHDCEDIMGKKRTDLINKGKFLQDKGTVYDILSELKDNNLLDEISGVVKFVHQSYGSYFAACYLKRMSPEKLLRKIRDELLEYMKWDETISLLLGIVDV